MNTLRKATRQQLFLPIVCVILVLAVNMVYDAARGAGIFNFFHIYIQNDLLQGRLINILNRGSEVAILAIGMTLVVSASSGTDISVGSVMSLCASFCCMLIAGFGVSSVESADQFAMPIVVGLIGALVMGVICGTFNGSLVAYLGIQPMVATLILFTAGRGIAQLVTKGQITYIRVDSYKVMGGYVGPIPTAIFFAVAAVAVVSLVLRKTALGLYIECVGINGSASRLVGLNSTMIKFLTYVICGVLAGVAGIVNSSRIYSADANNIGLNLEMDAILAVALGGNALGGGKFSLMGSVIGAYTIQALTTTLYAMRVSSDRLPVYKAVVVIIIVVLQSPVFKKALANAKAKYASGARAAKGGENT